MLTRVARWATALELPVVLAAAPFLMFPSPASMLAVVPAAAVWAILWRAGRGAVPSTPLNPALALIVAGLVLSLWATPNLGFSLGKIAGLVLGLLLFVALVRWTTSPGRLWLLVAAFVLAGAALAVIGLLGTRWVIKYGDIGQLILLLPEEPIRGVPGAEEGFNPNAVAGCLVLFIPVQVALLGGRAHLVLPTAMQRMALVTVEVILLLVTAWTILLTQSHSGWVGLCAAALAFLLWYRPWTRWAGALLVVGVVAVALAMGLDRAMDAAFSRSGADAAFSVGVRTDLWRFAIGTIAEAPITGIGMNMFRTIAPDHLVHAHNHFLQAALDLGAAGLAGYVALWVIVARRLSATYTHAVSRPMRALAVGLAMGLTAHFCFNLTDTIPLGAKVGVLFWVTLATAMAADHVAGGQRAAYGRAPVGPADTSVNQP